LYADDTVLLADSAEDLQAALNTYASYCDIWKLQLNLNKTKILVFSKGRQRNYHFVNKNEPTEIVNEYKYLGLLFSRSGSFNKAKQEIAKQATIAMYSLIKKAKDLCLSIDLQIDLFSKIVKPILLYGCEIWGFGNLDVLERVQLKFLKHILNVKSCTSNCIVYGETGTMPLSIEIKSRIVSFWAKLVCPSQEKLCNNIYALLLSYFKYSDVNLNHNFQWINELKNIFVTCGMNNIWDTHDFPNIKWLTLTVKQKLKDVFLNDWYSNLENASSCKNYRLFKDKFGFEDYLIKTSNNYLKYIIKFRTRNHKFPIETGQWNRTPLNERKCTLCNLTIGDEYHYLLECPDFIDKRKKNVKS
jgi:hypothetical protein